MGDWRPIWRFALGVGLLTAACVTAKATMAAELPVELELVLTADTSSSIRGSEFDLQIKGYADAFRDPGVVAAITGLGGNGIAAAFVQWSATFQQIEAVGWTQIRNAEDARRFADAIERQARRFTGFGTATGSAMMHAAAMFENNGFTGKRRVIDISSDERSNQGRHPESARDLILEKGITINGLAVQDRTDYLIGYFEDHVIGGPGAFVLPVSGFPDFAEAIRRKLIREISDTPLARLEGVSHRN
ncbi:MAG: DUF1194 domain-containing protein [Pseudomonadota bacterium]